MAAAIFWMKARAGWREKNELHVSMEQRSMEQMTDEELQDAIRQARLDVSETTREEVVGEIREEWIRTEGKALIEAAIREHQECSPPTNDR